MKKRWGCGIPASAHLSFGLQPCLHPSDSENSTHKPQARADHSEDLPVPQASRLNNIINRGVSLRNGDLPPSTLPEPPQRSSQAPSPQHQVCPNTSRSRFSRDMAELHPEYSDSSCEAWLINNTKIQYRMSTG
ncbi:BCL6A transcription repressor a isoform X1 [Lates japonicus]|uniref:BCL6A transcription repressor a isoform X1 n=1 Tax=Lates japonicus TaxID=270547 RepID=A0AAD3NHF0_LATJO|nr:BCL6A transcription repressor a isoform X1 [Lates japonicus]